MKNILSLICSLPEAAAILKLSEKRVLVFIDEGRIVAKKLKREWAIDLASVKALAKVPRPTGKRLTLQSARGER